MRIFEFLKLFSLRFSERRKRARSAFWPESGGPAFCIMTGKGSSMWQGRVDQVRWTSEEKKKKLKR